MNFPKRAQQRRVDAVKRMQRVDKPSEELLLAIDNTCIAIDDNRGKHKTFNKKSPTRKKTKDKGTK